MPRCLICQDLDESVSAVHGVPLRRIRDSFDEGCGCQTCGLLFQSYSLLKEPNKEEGDVIMGWDAMRLNGLRVVVKQEGKRDILFSADLYCIEGESARYLVARYEMILTNSCAEDKPPWKLKKHGESPTELSGDTASDAAISKIHEWIEECQSTHSCIKSSTALHLPTRVLDVSKPHLIRLHSTLEKDNVSYACLSHCWGSTQSLITTTTNILQHLEHIPWTALPRSFQDAVDITRRLGIRYLWIDSLCIIQDSQEDWQLESAKMASIYAGSTVTLAATLSSSDLHSFTSKSPRAHLSQRLTYQSESGTPQTIRIRKTLTHGTGPVPFPLLTRGWVLQERLLSPRVVHFTPDELIWECMERTTCECGCIRSLWSPGWVPFDKNLLYESKLTVASRADLREIWHQLVQEYSRLDLTFSRDRLPAISGAARRMSPFFRGCDYYAGLWKDNFVRDLMWKRRGPLQEYKKITRIPSWSWASVNTEVTFVEKAVSTTDMVAVMDVVMDYAPGSDQFGEVQGGTAVLSGFTVSIDRALKRILPADEGPGLNRTLHDLGVVTLDDDRRDYLDESSLLFLKLCFQTQTTRIEEHKETSLILTCVDANKSVFRRVGLLERPYNGSCPNFDIFDDVNETTTLYLN
ncbi:hypothetical protein SCUP234_05672 [Seiridium cupressi]